MISILIITALLPLYVLNSICDKACSSLKSDQANAYYNILKFLFGFTILFAMFAVSGKSVGLGAVLCGLLCGAMFAVSKIVILWGYEKSSVAMMTLFHSSGIILPCMFGWLFWGEKNPLLADIGMVLVVMSIWIMKKDTGNHTKITTKAIIIGIIVFLSSGFVMVSQKVFALYFRTESVTTYNLITFLVAFLLVTPTKFVLFKKEPVLHKRKLLICAVGSAVSLVVISQAMTVLSGKIPSVMLFPLFNGSGIILVTFVSAYLFKEKINRQKLMGISLGLLALILINIK